MTLLAAHRMVARARRRAGLALRMLMAVALSASMAPGQTQEMPQHKNMMTWEPTLFVLFDELEYSPSGNERPLNFEMIAWYGGSRNRVWFLPEGERNTRNNGDGEAEAQLLYGRLIDPFWDAVTGVRLDRDWGGAGQSRVFLSFGLLGLAPYRFEFAPMLFVSSKGEISARVEAAYQILVTQRLIAEPEVELNAALQEVPKAGLRRGLNDYDLQLRLRYEFRREFAPYVGWSRARRYGSAVSGSGEGQGTQTRFLVGLRLWR